MAVTLANLADEIQNLLNDAGAATWSQNDVEEWLNAAIRDFSRHLPRQITYDITTSNDDRSYDLPADFRSMLSVEYPQGEDPPTYLRPRPHHHPDFWQQAGYYDIIYHRDVGDPDELWISEEPDASETIRTIYNGAHDFDLASGDTITVPEIHHNILAAYVIWQTHRERHLSELANPYQNKTLLMQLVSSAGQAYNTYLDLLRQAQASESRSGPTTRAWRADGHDPIY